MGHHTVDIDGLKVGVDFPPRIMGVINLSPESFYRDSVVDNREQLVKVINSMEQEGADIIDVGGASTAPRGIYGTPEVTAEVELERVTSNLEHILRNTRVPISIDTVRSEVAEVAIDIGVSLVNDVSGLTRDKRMAKLVANRGVPIVLMAECGGSCQTLRASFRSVERSVKTALSVGIPQERIIIDPGIGFGKPSEVDLEIIRGLDRFCSLGHPVLVGISRKAFIGDLLSQPNPSMRLAGTIAATSIAVANGANLIRTHDVNEGKIAAKIGKALRRESAESENRESVE
ncbi:MAG: dihydropteroate synthase [Candidatus Thorarchaeota archaeon]